MGRVQQPEEHRELAAVVAQVGQHEPPQDRTLRVGEHVVGTPFQRPGSPSPSSRALTIAFRAWSAGVLSFAHPAQVVLWFARAPPEEGPDLLRCDIL